MKSFLLAALIALSLGINAVVIVGLVSPGTVAPLLGSLRPGSATSSPSSTQSSRPRANSGSRSAALTADATAAKWADLKSDDPATLVANLRSAGFGDMAIRAILSNQLSQKVNDRRKELAGPPQDTPYWRNPIGSTMSALYANPQNLAELREMSKQNTKLLDSLLGPSPTASFPSPYERLQYADLPSDKIDQIKLITADYADLNSSITIGTNGIYFPEDRAKLKLLNDEKDKDIRSILTPDEYDTYLFRSSNTANSMRNNLALFQPTEEEFRKIFALQYGFDQQFSTIGGIDLEQSRLRAQAQNDLTAQIKATLSPDRLADYEKYTDGAYKQAVALTTRLELPKNSADQIWALQKESQQKMTELRSDRSLAPDARNQALAALQQEMTSRATGILGGTRGFEAYKQNGGYWLQNMVPQLAPAGAIGGAINQIIISNGTVIRLP